MGQRGDMVRVGVVTPTPNAEEFLEHTLESIYTQRSDRLKIDHVIVDADPPPTREIAARYPSRAVVSTGPPGMYDAVNRAIGIVTGDFVGYINADDEIAPGALSLVSETLRAHPNVGWVCGRVEHIHGDGATLGTMKPVRLSLRSYLGLGWSCIPQQMVWARDARGTLAPAAARVDRQVG